MGQNKGNQRQKDQVEADQELKAWEVMDDGEKETLTKRVFSGGFGSELRVRKAFADEGFDSWTYYYPDKDDPSTGGKGGTA